MTDAHTPPPIPHAPVPLLISLSRGMVVSGITTWAVNLAGALAGMGRPVGLVVHRAAPGHAPLRPTLHPAVRVFDCTLLPDLGAAAGDLFAFIPAYLHALRSLAAGSRAPVVLSPNHLGDCYGIAAAISQVEPGLLRVIGYQHLLIPYDTHVLAHYEPIIARFVGVSDAICRALREALPSRLAEIRNVPYGVVVPEVPAPRETLDAAGARRPLRLIYTGRIEHDQKRVGALLALSDALAQRAISHRLTLVGDGPATPEIHAAIERRPAGAGVIVHQPAVGPHEVARLLDESDLFVLASRAEGLSVSLLEAMARGCVPVVTRTPSGTEQAIEPGRNGIMVEPGSDDDDRAVGRLLAAAVESAVAVGLPALSRAAWQTARSRFSLQASVAMTAQAIDECALSPARSWPTHRAPAFTGSGAGGGSGAVPADGETRLRDLLRCLAGRSIIIHGTGRHTLELARALADSPARILAFADDDPQRRARTLWNWPVIAPEQAGATGATDVVISSWINQEVIWERRAIYERQGLAVHRLYAGHSSASWPGRTCS